VYSSGCAGFQKLIGSGQMKPGYACDNDAGIYFEDNEVRRVVSTHPKAKAYHVSVVNGRVVEKVLEPESIAKSPDSETCSRIEQPLNRTEKPKMDFRAV
jgi:hypothetical protein